MVTDYGKGEKQFNNTQVLPNPANVAELEMTRLLTGLQVFSTVGIPGVCVTEVVHPTRKLNQDSTILAPNSRKMCGLFAKKTFEVSSKD